MPGQKTPDTTAKFSERRTRLPASAHNAPQAARPMLVADEPDSVDERWDAFLAAVAEHLCCEAGLGPPAWRHGPPRHLPEFWFAGGCFDFDRARTIATTPTAFDRHGVWLPRDEPVVV